MTPKQKKSLIAVAMVLILALLLILARVTSAERESISTPEQLIRELLAPLQNGASTISESFESWSAYIEGLPKLKAENEDLQDQISMLQQELVQYEETLQENARLESLLKMAENLSENYETVATTVINRSQSNWYKTMIINGGSRNGFEVGMPVMCAQGLLGRIINVSADTAEVLLILDREGAVSGILQNTRTVGVVEGDGESSDLSMIHIPYDVTVENYQQVLTSGYGGVYPKGLLIGYVNSVETEPGGLMIKANVKSYVDFDHIEDVLVLTYDYQSEADILYSNETLDLLK